MVGMPGFALSRGRPARCSMRAISTTTACGLSTDGGAVADRRRRPRHEHQALFRVGRPVLADTFGVCACRPLERRACGHEEQREGEPHHRLSVGALTQAASRIAADPRQIRFALVSVSDATLKPRRS